MKQEKKTKYYGEVWFPAYPNDKRFAFLTLANNKFEIETDLNPIKESKDLLEHYFDILGVFNGLGKVSFFYAILKSRSFGVVEAQKFSSNDKGEKKSYFIIGALLKEKKQTSGIGLLEKLGGIEFRIRDNTIRDWLSNSLKLDIPNKLSVFEKTKVINTEKFSIPFNNISLDDINITLFQGYSSHWRTYNYTIKNTGGVEFKFKEEKTVSCLLNKYKDMKIILKFLFNLSSKSDLVEIRPLNSEYWLQFYFWEVDLSNNISISVGARYGDFGKKNVKQILNKIYSNKNYVFIIQNIIQNYTPNELLGEHMFSSSIRTLEGFYKRFWTKKVNHYYEKEAKHRKDYIDLGDMLPEYEKYFQRIVKDKIENWKEFSQILINTRNNFIHCNTNQEIKEKCKTDESQCVYLHERVLRDLSFLIDYVVSFLILSELLDDSTKSEIIIKKYVERWDREFSHILNKILHKDNREILDIIEET